MIQLLAFLRSCSIEVVVGWLSGSGYVARKAFAFLLYYGGAIVGDLPSDYSYDEFLSMAEHRRCESGQATAPLQRVMWYMDRWTCSNTEGGDAMFPMFVSPE